MFGPYIIIPHVKSNTNFHRRATDWPQQILPPPPPDENPGRVHAKDIFTTFI